MESLKSFKKIFLNNNLYSHKSILYKYIEINSEQWYTLQKRKYYRENFLLIKIIKSESVLFFFLYIFLQIIVYLNCKFSSNIWQIIMCIQ